MRRSGLRILYIRVPEKRLTAALRLAKRIDDTHPERAELAAAVEEVLADYVARWLDPAKRPNP